MSRQEQLNLYIGHLQNRLRTFATLRGAAVIAFVALAATVLLTLILNRYAFPEREITPARIALYAAVGLALGFGLVLPWLRINRRRSIERAEGRFPVFEQRLLTFSERQQTGDPFVELLAGDTLARVQEIPASRLVPSATLLALFAATVLFTGAVVWMATAAPGFLGYGASLLWTGPKKIVTPLYDIHVTPGDAAVRRHSDEEITAQLVGLDTRKVTLHARVGAAAPWETVDMQPQANGQGFGFTLAALPENVEYFVEAGPVRSKHYTVRVVDLPAVKDMKVTYHYPRWTGMPQVTEEHGGDLRALEGTDAELTVTMDSPLRDGMLLLDNGQPLHLTGGEGNHYHGVIHMQKDGAYHVAASDSGQQVRLSEDYFISTEKANPPQVAIERPGPDYRASPIEEVTIGVKAGADFGLHTVQLHYSVNGGPTQAVDVLKQSGAKNSNGATTLNLESFKVVPGDVVSLYATAKDAHEEAKTDISFIQVDPFEREFSQSQQGGGGGGGGQGAGNQTDISRREKELIAATWKQQNDKTSTSSHAADMGKTLSEAQATLRQQVLALSARMESRDLNSANEEFTGFEKDMQAAAAAMVPSADKLKQQAWGDAMPNEQKALQALLRAEATFRKIQVAFGQQSGGGGGGGGSAGRDLASLFDLEMDTEKNQYETAQTGSPAEEQAKKVDDALARLDALAKRQEELAQQQSQQAQNFQQRWQQEMLRREAEQLQREMEQMQSQRGQQGQGASGQQGSSGGQSSSAGSQQSQSQQARGQSGSSSGSQSSGSPSGAKDGGADPRVQQALNRLREANEQMRRAAAPAQSGQAGAEQARAAAERLREATNLMGGAQKQQATGKLDSLANEAGKLQADEAAQAERMRSLAASSNDSARAEANAQELNRLIRDRQQLSDDVSHLQRSMRETARQLAPTQPAASSKLREALGAMDESDLGNRVQRTADGLRRRINPAANGNEAAVASGLKQLDESLKQAQAGMGSAAPGAPEAHKQGRGTEVAALDHLDRLRSAVQSLSAGPSGQPGSRGSQQGTHPGQSGQTQSDASQQGRQPGSTGNQAGQAGSQSSRAGSSRSGSRSGSQGQGSQGQGSQSQGSQGQGSQSQGSQGQGSQSSAGRQSGSGSSGGDRRPSLGGDSSSAQPSNSGNRVRSGGGGTGATWNVNTGNNTYDRNARAQQPGNGPTPADSERTIDQGMQELSRLRQLTHGDPAASREVEALVKEMQQLQPGRFPGNPQMVEQLHQQVLNDVDKLELELRRNANDPALAQVHASKPATVPQGYGDAVAEYYRRLGKGQ